MRKSVLKAMGSLLLSVLMLESLAAQSRKTEIWDFGGVQDAGDVINHLSIADIDAIEQLAPGGRFSVAGEISWGDVTLNFVNNDRMYFESSAEKSAGNQGYQSLAFDDGYVSNGIYYCNGTGGEKRRYILLQNVHAGDTVTFYAGTSNASAKDVHFAHLTHGTDKNIGTDLLVLSGEQDEHAPLVQASAATATRYSYIALHDGAYKIYADANAGKPVFYRVVRTPAVQVSGALQLPASLTADDSTKAQLAFLCRETNQLLSATIEGTTYHASLAGGHSYMAMLTGISGYSIAKKDLLVDVTATAPGAAKTLPLRVAELETVALDGCITGLQDGYDASQLKVILEPPAGSIYQRITCTTEKTGTTVTYRGNIEPGVQYAIVLSGANDYEITSNASITATEALSFDIAVAPRATYAVDGRFIGEVSLLPAKVTFTHTDGSVYTGTIKADGSYSVSLRDGTYTAASETAVAKTTNHVVVNGKPLSKDLNLVKKDTKAKPLPLKKDLYIGGKKADCSTLAEALALAKAMNPQKESDRITIHIAPGIYRQQLIIDTPYLTLKNDTPAAEVKLTWYYGIGYQYYSADEKGFYNADLAHDKFTKAGVARWGVATYIKPTATAFRAEGITFESSFNKYVCDEEIADGVESDGSISFVRRISSDVRAKKATERAAALCSEADFCEYVQCRFIGSQDTLYTGDNTHQYFKRCYIEGQTDFIFGGGDVLFENCELCWCGYSSGENGGYLTAARNPLKAGYVFYNCALTKNLVTNVDAGYFGRPWGQNAKVAFINLKLFDTDLIEDAGWTKMSANTPEKAAFREYNTTFAGAAVDTASRVAGTVLGDDTGYTPLSVLGSWTPAYFADSKSVAKAKPKFAKKPVIISNDDINTPYPGHTLTVSYSLAKADDADTSMINWYREKNGKKELVLSSTGFATKSYLVTSIDQNAKISVEVTPRLRNGTSGEALTAELTERVKEGHALVAAVGAGGARDEDKLNIFLAGDSTVRDYSEKGMWSQGKNRDEGSWGEFIAAWFTSGVAFQNYANGGRSTRNFINEGNLDRITRQMQSGDYLLIQFGHNDENLSDPDRGVTLGKPNGKGMYPLTEGKKSATAAAFVKKYGDESYTEDSGGTYKWFLKQYIDAARSKGATPVLVTPVSRLKFDKNGKIMPHHDADDAEVKNDSYVTAMRQLAKEENVALIDGFELTKSLYEKAWILGDRTDTKARALMTAGDSTHSSKLGGFITAGLFAEAIQKTLPALAAAVTKPRCVAAQDQSGALLFSVDSTGHFSASDDAWTSYVQALIDARQ